MKRKDIAYDSEETDVKELQRMVEELEGLINDTEERVNNIVDNLESIKIDNMQPVETAYEIAKELSSDLY